MTPTPAESAADTTNAIHQTVLRLAEHLPKFGYQIVDNPADAALTVGHAGQGALEGVDVAHCHGLYPTGMVESEKWHWAANRAVIRNLTSALEITVPSRWVAEIIERDMHIKPAVIGWAVDSDQWQPDEPYNYVLWNKTRADSTCDPTPMNELARRANGWQFLSTFGKAADNVKLIGRVPHAQMKDIIQHAGVYLATTKETFGIGTLEAMAAGVPILGYRWGGTADIVEHGVTGYLAEPGNVADLLQGLEYCKQYRRELGANARFAAKGYSWESVARVMASVYDKAQLLKSNYAPPEFPLIEFAPPHPLVTIVIPLYNYARFVNEAVSSVIAQEAPFSMEMVIVDDGSTDAGLNALDPLFSGFKGIVQTYRIENSGVAVARNYGIAKARGKYIVCLDADDRLGSPDFVRTLAAALEANRELGIAYTGLAVMDEFGLNVSPSEWPGPADYDQQAKRHNQIPTCCMFRREAWLRAGGYRRRFSPAEDAHLWLSIGAIGFQAAKVTDAPMFHYRMHSNSLSTPIRTGESKEPDWTLYAPWVNDGQRPFAAGGKPPYFSWPVRNYDNPLVSIIIPVGPGHVGLLREALDSVEGQTWRFWECICVNDTGEALPDTLTKAYPFVRWIQSGGVGKGAGVARNMGIKAARAALVTFLDSDDILEPTFLDETIKAYYRGKGEYIYTDWLSLNKENYLEINETPEFEPNDVFKKTSIHAVNILIPRDYLLQVGLFDESMSAWEDVDLFMKLAAAGICGKRLAKPLFTYRYVTGKRRESGETVKAGLLAFLRRRYNEYIEGDMCTTCGGTAAPLNTFVSSLTGFLSMAKENTDNMVEVQYSGALAPIELYGPATGQNYGRRANGEVFMVWKQDADADPAMFRQIGANMQHSGEQAPAEPPPAPPLLPPTVSPTGDEPLTDDELAALGDLLGVEPNVLKTAIEMGQTDVTALRGRLAAYQAGDVGAADIPPYEGAAQAEDDEPDEPETAIAEAPVEDEPTPPTPRAPGRPKGSKGR